MNYTFRTARFAALIQQDISHCPGIAISEGKECCPLLSNALELSVNLRLVRKTFSNRAVKSKKKRPLNLTQSSPFSPRLPSAQVFASSVFFHRRLLRPQKQVPHLSPIFNLLPHHPHFHCTVSFQSSFLPSFHTIPQSSPPMPLYPPSFNPPPEPLPPIDVSSPDSTRTSFLTTDYDSTLPLVRARFPNIDPLYITKIFRGTIHPEGLIWLDVDRQDASPPDFSDLAHL